MGKCYFKSILRKIKNKLTPEDPFKKGFTAKQANLGTVYTTPLLDNEKRLNSFYYKVNKEIFYRMSQREFQCIVVVPIDLSDFKDTIISHYCQLGYQCIELASVDTCFVENVIYVDWSSYKNENNEESES